MIKDITQSYLDAALAAQKFAEDENNIKLTIEIAEAMADTLQKGGRILSCGNGGSSCDSMHFAEELTGRFRKERPALSAISLTDVSHVTCVGNDYGFNEIFARGVQAYGRDGDILIAISTSGNSPNIIRAVEEAKKKNMKVLGMLGKDGGKMKGTCDWEFIIPGSTSDRIQEVHMIILHIIIEGIERILYPENY